MQYDIKLHDGKLFVNIENLLDYKDVIINQLHQIQENLKNQQQSQQRYKWNDELLKKFALEVTKFGIKTVKPKNIQWKFELEGLKNHQIGSHLQKYKLRIQQEYKLKSFDEFENWMILSEYHNDADVIAAAQKWNPTMYTKAQEKEIISEKDYNDDRLLEYYIPTYSNSIDSE
ncbi:Conserved_hypothetical protein [Hexamita inflata]|uniref:Myb-like domain-containing protein n=1 Tax=Hexamita inflata TaxID=28002 RepID=A0AA86R5E0_9EUKA|nr:Conserved hypothetical protein [Hexamita inflata]CAI9930853.1 Conserved hypothetical protein [Hexamita inflata]CAI9969682.1 Conserved hypothetical protein [Hexamita inflata]CAI9971667.1 Conserved hypothetical protein [Hexamita inflata]